MCGIVGYVGYRPASELLLDGLSRLEYRGYDSAGIAVVQDRDIAVRKRSGRVAGLIQLVESHPVNGSIGIGHTRWATHGETTDVNAHPHLDESGRVVLVHNGVIENHDRIRERLTDAGGGFRSTTDTEVIAQLIGWNLDQLVETGRLTDDPQTCWDALESTLAELKGTFGLAVLFRDCPGSLWTARCGSPLVIGVGRDEHFLASDTSPLVGYTRDVVYLDDHDVARLSRDGLEVRQRGAGTRDISIQTIEDEAVDIELGEFPHYMLKEIFEQPQSIRNALRGRLDLDNATAIFGGLNADAHELRHVDRIVLTACGTSWYAGLVGEYLIEEFARIPTEVE
ncbi:MAG: isomerizing glutamine--fructose-6-phosphate transaminase, partial [Planctomycetaceae bacterium]